MTALMADVQTNRVFYADQIVRQTHAEAKALAAAEYERVLAVMEQLKGEDWAQPTYCTEWSVREMVAHLAGAAAAYATWADFKAQFVSNPYAHEFDEQVDGINKRQLEDRGDYSNAQLVDEFRRVGPKAIRTRQGWLSPLRGIPVPMGPPIGTKPIGYLMDTIYTRDQWMHRYDLCAATGKEMVVTPDHDGRIVELVLLDLAQALEGQNLEPVELELTGQIGGVFHFGARSDPLCKIRLDVFDFNLLASDRISATDAGNRAEIDGDRSIANLFLEGASIPY